MYAKVLTIDEKANVVYFTPLSTCRMHGKGMSMGKDLFDDSFKQTDHGTNITHTDKVFVAQDKGFESKLNWWCDNSHEVAFLSDVQAYPITSGKNKELSAAKQDMLNTISDNYQEIFHVGYEGFIKDQLLFLDLIHSEFPVSDGSIYESEAY